MQTTPEQPAGEPAEQPAAQPADEAASSYAAFAQELYDTNIISDPWLEGQERFRLEPVVLPGSLYERICAASEGIARAYDELARIIWERPALVDSYFSLTPYQKLMWFAAEGRWHGIARLDIFVLADGSIRTCEMNSDTPSGEAEAVIINNLLHRHHPDLADPNTRFEERFVEMVMGVYASGAAFPKEGPLSIGILYPTDLPEDLSMIALYRRWFERRGHTVTLGSPYNVAATESDRVALFDTPIDILIRHYKTDWWGERVPAWSDEEEYNDPEPIDLPLRLLLDADASGRVAVINPFGAVVTQNKLTMAFMWDNLELFSPESRETITTYIPETRRLCDVAAAELAKDEWVLKSDYGCEGDEVVIGRSVDDTIWSTSLAAAKPERWIVQRYFEAAPIEGDQVPNYGVYVIGGQAAGIFSRLSSHATDYGAVVPPTYVRNDEI
jgi:glutathionylspermidine synthase